MSRKTAKLFAIFIFSAILLNYPIIGVFSKLRWLGGLPASLVYLFIVWLLVIVVIRFIVDSDTPSV